MQPRVGNMRCRNTCRLLCLIVVTALALRLAVIPFNNFEMLMNPDHLHAWEQGNVAEALLAGQGFGSPFASIQPSAIMPPVYPLIVAVLFKIFGIHTTASIFAVHALNCLLNALACFPIFLLARNSFGERVAWWAAWGWAFSPYGIYFSAAWAWSTHMLLLCLCWLLYLSQKLEASPRLFLWAGFGGLAGFAGLVEPSVLTVAPFLLILACRSLFRARRAWFMPLAVAGLSLLAALSPWMIRNAIVFHRFIPMRDSMGLEMWMGNNGYSLRWTSDQLHPLHDAQELADYDHMGELAYMKHKSQQASAYIKGHPAWYATMCIRRAVYLWTGFWSFNPDYLRMEPMDPANIPFTTTMNLLAIFGLIAAWRKAPMESIRFGGVLFLFPILYYFSHPEPYHLRPLDPLILILICHFLVSLRERSALKAAAFAMEPIEAEVA